MSFFEDLIYGKKASTEQMPTMNQGQQDLLQKLLSGLGGPMGMGMENMSNILSGDPEALKAFQAPMMRQFNEQIVPGIANQFAGSDSQSSSAFTNQLGAAGAGLQENLSAQKSNLQQNAMQQLMGMMGQGLGAKPFENVSYGAQASPLAGLMGGIGQGVGQMGGMGGMASILKWLKGKE